LVSFYFVFISFRFVFVDFASFRFYFVSHFIGALPLRTRSTGFTRFFIVVVH
jgi:hypothetical protein